LERFKFGTAGTLEELEQLEPFEHRMKETTMTAQSTYKMHAGRVLLEEFLAPKGVSVWHLAKDIGVPVRRIFEIVQGQRSINADIAHRLAHYFGMSERYWLDLQARYDGKQEDRLSREFTKKQSLRYAG
jgi:addiction module HigA family antidote